MNALQAPHVDSNEAIRLFRKIFSRKVKKVLTNKKQYDIIVSVPLGTDAEYAICTASETTLRVKIKENFICGYGGIGRRARFRF